MNKEFIPYEQALALKELGFNEPCIATYDEDKEFEIQDFEQNYDTFPSHIIAAPLYQQAFRWFRERYNLYGFPKTTFGSMNPKQIVFFYYWIKDGEEFTNIKEYNTYEEAELACLKKLIEIVKGGNK
jgi:hypothetical protein